MVEDGCDGDGQVPVPPCCGCTASPGQPEMVIEPGCGERAACHPAGISDARQTTLTLLNLSLCSSANEMNESFIGVS